jgi:hypothetical protein
LPYSIIEERSSGSSFWAIVRGYFDASADTDINLFKKQGTDISLPIRYSKVEGLEIHCHLVDYEDELTKPWDMAKRWTFSLGQIHYDPQGWISKLLEEKVPLGSEEKRWLLMSGLTLSEWYINRLTHLWVKRGNLISAHHMFDQSLNYFFDMLFALNNQLVADKKWRYYCAERLAQLPPHFEERIKNTMLLQAFSVEEPERRQGAFMEMWRDMVPIIEQEVDMPYAEFSHLIKQRNYLKYLYMTTRSNIRKHMKLVPYIRLDKKDLVQTRSFFAMFFIS